MLSDSLYPPRTTLHSASFVLSVKPILSYLVCVWFIFFRAVNGSLAETPEFVVGFLKLLAKEIMPRAKKDFAEMDAMKRAQYPHSRVSSNSKIMCGFISSCV